MCRMLLLRSREPVLLADLLTKPIHSIINQAFDSRLRLDTRRPINGDGFGVGWYDQVTPEASDTTAGEREPCIFTSITPAWSNQNLDRLARKIKSPLVFAHVRASTMGQLSESNCHPWSYGRLLWMHNGNIAGFALMKRQLVALLDEQLWLNIQGTTDSEHAFALFLQQLRDPRADHFETEELQNAMLKTIQVINQLLSSLDPPVTEPSLLNFAVTDGSSICATRYVNSQEHEAASLFFSSGTEFFEEKVKDESGQCRGSGHYRMIKADRREDIVLIASEPLTFEKADWMEIPTNTLITVTPLPYLNVLLTPILDEYHENSSSQATSPACETRPRRNSKYVNSMGQGIASVPPETLRHMAQATA